MTMMNTSFTKRALAVAAGAALLGASLVSCSSSNEAGDDAALDVELISQMPAAQGPVDQIAWNLTAGEPTTLDPRNAVTYSSGQVVSNLCDFLNLGRLEVLNALAPSHHRRNLSHELVFDLGGLADRGC